MSFVHRVVLQCVIKTGVQAGMAGRDGTWHSESTARKHGPNKRLPLLVVVNDDVNVLNDARPLLQPARRAGAPPRALPLPPQ